MYKAANIFAKSLAAGLFFTFAASLLFLGASTPEEQPAEVEITERPKIAQGSFVAHTSEDQQR